MSEHRTFESIKYSFTADELLELGEVLARETAGVFDLEKKKAARAAEISAQLKQANRRCEDLAAKINNGYELREVECFALLEVPRPGMKRIIRADTNETVREEPMTMQEMQTSFGFKEEPDDEDGKTKGGGA